MSCFKSRPAILVYGVTATSTALVFLLVIACEKLVQSEFPGQFAGPLFLFSVVFSAWFGGKLPGLFAATLAYVILNYFFLPTIYTLDPRWVDVPIGGVYVLTALVVSILQERRLGAESTVVRFKERMLLAKNIQSRLLPQAPPAIAGFDIGGVLQSAEETGGDFYDFIPLHDDRICIAVGDVSGHGFPSALLMAETRAYLRALAQGKNADVREILGLTNTMLLASTADGCFVTMFIASIHPKSRLLTFAGAGHDAILLRATGRLERLNSTGMPLGVAKQHTFQAPAYRILEDRDVLVVVTDGIVESRSRRGDQFGINRIVEVINTHRDKSACEMADRLTERVRAFSGGLPQEDDMTAVVVKVND